MVAQFMKKSFKGDTPAVPLETSLKCIYDTCYDAHEDREECCEQGKGQGFFR